jgi:peptide/nickel transport system ATP-binding protein
MQNGAPPVILEAIALSKYFRLKSGQLRAVDNVSIKIRTGETLAIVGESGCGKSTLARLLLRLIEPTAGDVVFEGKSLGTLTGSGLRALRRDMQMIFQDPFASLNPAMSIGAAIEEPLWLHGLEKNRKARRERVGAILQQVGLSPGDAQRYPHEFSGGQRQRISIARALASSPKLILGDEPLSALDVSVQAQILNLLADLKEQYALTFVIVGHDLAMVRHMSDRVAVMYLGEIVEVGSAAALFDAPLHPYTQALIASIPAANPKSRRRLTRLKGEAPSPAAPPKGCRFHTRCVHAKSLCADVPPTLDPAKADRQIACHFWKGIAAAGVSAMAVAPPNEALDRRLAMFRKNSEEQAALAQREGGATP